MSKINIGFGITRDWLKYTSVVMCSILANANSENYKFFIMSDFSEGEFEQEFSDKYQKLKDIYPFDYEYIKMNPADFEDVLHDERVGISALYRLKLASLTNEDKMLYLDSDIVVLKNISELWNYDISGYLLGAVEDKYSELMTCQADLGDDETYYNSGVLLMNLKKFREENVEQVIFPKLREPENAYSDQDVLNNVCRNKILSLPLKYNLMLTNDDPNAFPKRKDEFAESLCNPVILHYAIKPWILPVQYSEYWRKYADIIK